MSNELSVQEQAYLQGFMDKCAEYNVDPDALVKAARLEQLGKTLGALAGKVKGPMLAAAKTPQEAAMTSLFADVAQDPNTMKLMQYWLPRGGETQRQVARNLRDFRRGVTAFKPETLTSEAVKTLASAPGPGEAVDWATTHMLGGNPSLKRIYELMIPGGNMEAGTGLAAANAYRAAGDTPLGRALMAIYGVRGLGLH